MKKPVSMAEELQTVWFSLLFPKPLYSPNWCYLLSHMAFMCNAQFFLPHKHTPLRPIHINRSVECVYVHVFIKVSECKPSVCKKSKWMTHFVPLSNHLGVGKWHVRPFYHCTEDQYRCGGRMVTITGAVPGPVVWTMLIVMEAGECGDAVQKRTL